MTQYLEGYKKNIAIALRKKGSSYEEIKISLGLPKSTIAYWLKGIKLTPEQRKILHDRRSQVAKKNSEKKILKTAKAIAEIQKESAGNIQKITAKELWLMGIMLYWRSRSTDDIRKGVHFTSSNPRLIKFFLKWLQEVGQITDEEITFDLFIGKNRKNTADDIIAYWSKAVGFPVASFSHVYLQAGNKSANGLVRIRVKASTMLARQISGWIKGIQEYYWGNYDDAT